MARLLGVKEVRLRTGMGRTTIWRLERRGEFPRRRQIVGGRVGWLEGEVDDWIRSRPVADAAAPGLSDDDAA